MATVFVTGASGFVGRKVCRRLTDRGHEVIGLARQLAPNTAIVQGDLLEPATYRHHLTQARTVIHLAALTGKAARQEYFRVNVEGTKALIDAARDAGVSRLLFCSTIAVRFPDKRRYPYAQSKTEAERLVGDSGIAATIVRPTMIGGEGSPVLSKFASMGALPIVPAIGGGRAAVQPILVDDLAAFIVDIVETDRFRGEALELGGRDILSLRDILDRFHRLAHGRPARFVPVPLGLLLPVLRMLEPLVGPALPITPGQLATFRFDGVATPNALWQAKRAELASIDDILAASRPA